MRAPSGYSLRVSTARSRLAAASADSDTNRAVGSGTSCAMRTGSKREPGCAIDGRQDLGRLHAKEAARRCATSSRRLNGSSDGVIFTANVATLVTSGRPLRS